MYRAKNILLYTVKVLSAQDQKLEFACILSSAVSFSAVSSVTVNNASLETYIYYKTFHYSAWAPIPLFVSRYSYWSLWPA